MSNGVVPHCNRDGRTWLYTSNDVPRGYIQPSCLVELWFHMGTNCNLGCSFCFEGSLPDDDRIEALAYSDVREIIKEALWLGVKQFSFTGGEPFVNADFLRILNHALERRPCLVLTNGTAPLRRRLEEVLKLKEKPFPASFRISLDHPDEENHDRYRGRGNFAMALKSLMDLHRAGFNVSVARHQNGHQDYAQVDERFRFLFDTLGLPHDLKIVAFPDYFRPGSDIRVPEITENCMTTYKDEKSRAEFMCNFSKMIVKRENRICVYACNLVDDDADYDLGSTLQDSMKERVMLKHHRCYSCFSSGDSCSELNRSHP